MATPEQVPVPAQGQRPITLAEVTEENVLQFLEQSATIREVMENIDFRPARISIEHRSRKFMMAETAANEVYLIVVYFHRARGYWTEEGGKAPLCSSMDGRTGTAREGSGLEWEGRANSCAGCPFNEFGSDPKGGGGKACKEIRRLFVIDVDPKTMAPQASLPAILSLPPTSLKPWDEFVSGLLSRKPPMHPIRKVVRLGLNEVKGETFSYATVTVAPVADVPTPLLAELLKMQATVRGKAAELGLEHEDYPMGDQEDKEEEF